MSPPDRDMWTGMLAELRAQHPSICRQWFDDLEPLGIEDGAFRVQAHTPVHRDYLRTHCLDSFNDALQSVSGRLLSVRFLGPGDADNHSDRDHTAARPGADRLGPPAARAENTPDHHAGAGRDAGSAPTTGDPDARRETERTTDPHADRSVTRAATEAPQNQAGAATHKPPTNRTSNPDQHSNRAPASSDAPASRDGHAAGYVEARPGPGLPPANPYEPSTPLNDRPQLRLAGLPDPEDAGSADGRSPGDRGGAEGAIQTPHAPAGRGPVRPRPGSGSGRDDALVINPDHTFDTFVVGPSNRLAHAAAVAVANAPGRSYNPLFIHGGVGLGKTHLLQAIALRIHAAHPEAVIYYLSCESFMTQFVEAVQAGLMNNFRQRFRDVDVLIVDDIHFLAKGDTSQEEFFHTFNTLHHASKQLVLSSDAPPEEIPHLEERLVSRFKWGLVAPVDPPGYETRIEILKSKARIRGVELEHAVAAFVADRVKANIRELEGALTQLQVRAGLDRRPIDLELAREALGDPPASARPQAPTIERIIEAVTDFYGVRLADLQSRRRHRSVTLPRQVCMYLARKLTRNSLEEIGGYFGGRDHTTVMHAVKAVELKRAKDAEFARVLESFEQRLGQSGVEHPR